MRVLQTALLGMSCLALSVQMAAAAPIVIDFETEDDFTTPLVNGQDISTPPEFGNLVSLSATGSNLGLAIFDSDVGGPNDPGADADLLVDLGNILILQSSSSATQTIPGVFDVPNDSRDGGTMDFAFVSPTELLSIDLIDIDGGNALTLTLTDTAAKTRTYSVPFGWTNDVRFAPVGFDTLDLTTLAGQLGEGGSTATAIEDVGFDPTSVDTLAVQFDGSGGIDNLTIVPEPGSMTLSLLAMLGFVPTIRRRRK